MPQRKILAVGAAIAVLAVVGYALWSGGFRASPVVCDADAMQCPDGSTVGRVGPACEFAPCARVAATQDDVWVRDEQRGYEYPQRFITAYVRPQIWPPYLTVAEGTLTCPEGAQRRTIGGSEYCVQHRDQLVDGSTYVASIYSTEREGRVVALDFTLIYLPCTDREGAESDACESEQAIFKADLDAMLDRIAQSVKVQ